MDRPINIELREKERVYREKYKRETEKDRQRYIYREREIETDRE